MTMIVERRCAPGALAGEITRASGRLMMLFCAERDGTRELRALISLGKRVLDLRAQLYGYTYPAVTPLVPAAHWFERELHDLWGVVPAGHPRLEPLIRHDGDALADGGVVGDALGGGAAARPAGRRGSDRLRGDGVFVIPYGPVRSGVLESAQFFVQTGGEDIAYCAQRLFFKRRGVERRITELPPALGVLVAERASGTSSVAHALAFSHAVEQLCGAEAPPRAQAIRRVLAELERLHNHLEVTVRECEDAALSVAQAQFAALKERLHRLAATLTGNRFLRGVIVPGGVRTELATGPLARLQTDLDDWSRDFNGTLELLLRTDSFLDRLVGAGPLSESDARDFGCVGPVARGSGVDIDSRRDQPYDGYGALAVPTRTDGDAMARMEVRFDEVRASLEVVRAACGAPMHGPFAVPIGPFTSADGLGVAESARGETLYWLEADGRERLRACKLRAASFVNYGVFNRVFEAQVLTDFAFIEHSLGLSPAGCDA
jgi:Ni,Fe-hydrogenase III large subunit